MWRQQLANLAPADYRPRAERGNLLRDILITVRRGELYAAGRQFPSTCLPERARAGVGLDLLNELNIERFNVQRC